MHLFSPGTRLRLADGTTVTVGALLGAGGQGEVYRVRTARGAEMALKWYTAPALCADDAFHASMQAKCEAGAPSPVFLWPVALTERRPDGSFGYIMPLRPDDFIELGDFFCIDRNPDAWFRSNMAKVCAAMRIADSFSRLHLTGCCYQDINDGNFFVNPHTGEVLVCDNDNIVVDGTGHGIAGKPRYMAPEVIAGDTPRMTSDRLSLSIILYRIFMTDHPFEGRATASATVMTPEAENRLFGAGAVFCHDPDNDSNRPDPALHPNSALFWEQMPPVLRNAFCAALSRRALAEPKSRPSAARWKAMMVALRACLLSCRADRKDPLHDFLADSRPPGFCPRCGLPVSPFATLALDNGTTYRLSSGKELFVDDGFIPAGICTMLNVRGRGVVPGLENRSGRVWKVTVPGSRPASAEPGCAVAFADGVGIDFGNIKGTIIYPGV